jgi:hypothetical protein
MINNHKSLQTAQEFLRSIGWTKPGDLSLDEMLNFKGASIHQAELKNYEGRVILHGQNSIVRINSNMTNDGK